MGFFFSNEYINLFLRPVYLILYFVLIYFWGGFNTWSFNFVLNEFNASDVVN